MGRQQLGSTTSGPSYAPSYAPCTERSGSGGGGIRRASDYDVGAQPSYTGAPAVLVSPHVGTWRAADEQTIASLQISEHASQTAWVTFVSEDGRKMWRELTSIFAEESQVFKRLISYDLDPNTEESDPIEIIPGLRRDSVYKLRYHLQGITPWDLDALLTGLKPKLGQEALFEQLCPMLVLATDWQFNNVRDFAIKALTEYDDLPVPRIMLARRAKVADWLIGSYLELVLRLAPPTEHEAELLGIPSILTISKVREKVMIRRLSPISNNRPAVLLGKLGWWHFRCRYALTSAWRRALTKEHDKAATPECAMMTALEEIKLRTGRGLCRTCSPEKVVIEWLNLEEDRRIAKSMLKETLGVTMEMWVGSRQSLSGSGGSCASMSPADDAIPGHLRDDALAFTRLRTQLFPTLLVVLSISLAWLMNMFLRRIT